MKKTLFFSLVLFSVWARAQAQIKLTGTVKDTTTQMPLEGVIVNADGLRSWQTTDAQGNFTLTLQSPGNTKLTFYLMGFVQKTQTFSVTSGGLSGVQVFLIPQKQTLAPVEVSAVRATPQTPVSYTNLSKAEINSLNTGRDVSFLLEQTANVVATSDAGTGIGYTNLRVRGSDITRINVTVNGIPINDAESQSVFWVNMPDLASSTSSLQLQRGVGTSTNGAAAFGASLNMQTDALQTSPNGMLHIGAGSFATQRYTAQFGTGLINQKYWFNGRLSHTRSNGYVDRATANLKSYYFAGGYSGKKTSVKLIAFGGQERTYQAWYGVDSATFATAPTTNYAGAIYDANGNIASYYKDQVDNYNQYHYQLHTDHIFNSRLRGNFALHYTKGLGYYEEYQQDATMSDYGILPLVVNGDTTTTTDLVRRKWLDNDFYGAIFSLQYQHKKITSTFGGGINQYDGQHYGRLVWARFANNAGPDFEYYNSLSKKNDANVYWKNSYQFNPKFTGYVDVQVRYVKYTASGKDDDVGDFNFAQKNTFFNPKLGVTYNANATTRLFLSYAVANKEPNRTDLLYAGASGVLPEKLQDVELGFDKIFGKVQLKTNAFYMYYTNQLVLSGRLDAVGNPIRENIGQSYRTGIEIAAVVPILKNLNWQPNISVSNNKNLDFVVTDENGNTENLGTTNIAYSPNIVGASMLQYTVFKGFEVALFTKYVGAQFLSNEQNTRHKLPAYLLNDLRFEYTLTTAGLQNVRVYVNLQNIFDVKYASNGYMYGPTPYYYAQAGRNFLAGIQVNF